MVYSLFLLVLVTLGFSNCVYGASRSSPPSGSLTVGPSGTYKTISAAVRAASKGNTIFIYAGTYKEAVYITTSGLTIYGQTSECVIFILHNIQLV
jgi:pectinesterase